MAESGKGPAPGREVLIREFQRDRLRLLAYIRSLVGDPDAAEDIFQGVSVVVLQKADEFVAGRDLQAWCRGIARNLILRERKTARRLRPFEDDRLADLVDSAFAESSGRDLVDAHRGDLRRCMELLAEQGRQLVQLRYGSGLSLRQIAARLERTEGAVQVALSRIRKWLSDCVQRRGVPGAELQA
jgi:RNA polymerase sigma-70 factor (ECF subfamily)